MSSVLSPVGPNPARVYWVRRLVVLVIPLIVIIAVAVSCSGGGGGSPSANSGTQPPTPGSSGSSTTACAPGDLSVMLSTSEPTYDTGQSPVFTATVTNDSTSACRLTLSPSKETWTVMSGAAQWWTTIGCPSSITSTTKTLAAAAIHKVSITWTGHRLLPGCTSGEAALPGTYHLTATIDGVQAEQVIFHFTKNTA